MSYILTTDDARDVHGMYVILREANPFYGVRNAVERATSLVQAFHDLDESECTLLIDGALAYDGLSNSKDSAWVYNKETQTWHNEV